MHLRIEPEFDRIVERDAPAEVLVTGLATGEGPVWMDGALLFTDVGISPGEDRWHDVHPGRLWRWTAAEGARIVGEDTGHAVGATQDADGRLILCEGKRGRVTRREADGTATLLAASWRGVPFSNPNDVVVRSDGSIYFTDSGAKPRARPFHGVYRIPPGGGEAELVARDFQLVNGLAFSPDESILYVNDSHGASACPDFFYGVGTIRAYDVLPAGQLARSRLLCELRGPGSGVPDGMKVDAAGNVYCTGPDGIWVMDAAGRHLGTLDLGVAHNLTNATNLAWGGEALDTLFITTLTTVLRLPMKARGLPACRNLADAG